MSPLGLRSQPLRNETQAKAFFFLFFFSLVLSLFLFFLFTFFFESGTGVEGGFTSGTRGGFRPEVREFSGFFLGSFQGASRELPGIFPENIEGRL
jgi:hypothetical protein